MSRPFTIEEIQQMRRLLEAVVPHGCSVQVASINAGWRASLVICGRVSCHSYDLQPPMSRGRLLAIAEAWESGRYVPDGGIAKAAEKALWVHTEADTLRWARGSQHGQRVAYFEGSVVHFRHESGRRLRELQSQSDRRNGKTKKWAERASEMDRLQEKLDLLNAVEKLRAAGVIDLVQQRLPSGDGAIYFAVRK